MLDLAPIQAALAELSEPQLNALKNAAKGVPQIAPGLLAWIEAACAWELNSRIGLRYELLPPEAAIGPEEDAISIEAAVALGARFVDESPALRALFDALLERLTGGERKH